jgi:hypothetical protein
MDVSRFDAIARAISTVKSRRELLSLVPTLVAAGAVVTTLDDEAAAGRRRRRKARHHRRQARRSRNRRQRTCTPRPVAKVCAGTCGTVRNRKTCGRRVDCGPCGPGPGCPECAENEVCRNSTCQTCTVTCASGQTPEECGAAIVAALADASLTEITICPGTYLGNFVVNRAVTLTGAGQGPDPTINTILSAVQPGRVLWLQDSAGNVTLENLRLTGGELANDFGAGILNQGAGLTMTNCTVTGNQGDNVTGVGIYSLSSLQMTACEVSDNTCTSGDEALAGGIFAQGNTTLEDCLITGNTSSGEAGGILVASGLTSLTGQTTVSDNVAAGGAGILVAGGAILWVGRDCLITHNTATEEYGGIANEGAVTLDGPSPESIVVNNCPNNCLNVFGCTEDQLHCPT